MREAKFAASVFGVITACLIGGGAVAYNAAPQVSTRDNFEVVEPASEELTLAAAETSVKTTTATSVKKANTNNTGKTLSYSSKNTSYKVTTTVVTEPVTTTTTTAAPTEAATTAPTEAYTEAETEYYYYEAPTYLEELQTEPETYYQPETEAYSEPEAVYTEPETEEYTEPAQDAFTETTANALPISDSDFILLCNVVGHEAGSYWISEYEKACVVEVVMNRVNSPLYPNTIYGVLTQPYQFSGCYSYVDLGTYSGYVTESVKNAVNLYFSDPSQFSQGYFSFYGDGYRNYFR